MGLRFLFFLLPLFLLLWRLHLLHFRLHTLQPLQRLEQFRIVIFSIMPGRLNLGEHVAHRVNHS